MEPWEEYMDSDIYGIFSTYEKAQEKVKEIFKQKMLEDEYLEEEDLEYYFDIVPFEVDK
jgi:hypothetical protein